MPAYFPFRRARTVSLWILSAIIVLVSALPCEASGLFSLGAGHTWFRESQALHWDPSWYVEGTCFFEIRPGLQLGLSAGYYFIQAKPASEIYGIGVYWEEPQGDSWMFSLLPALRVPFNIGDDGSTQVYIQGGLGWYHLDMDVLYLGTMPFGGGTVEKRLTDRWDKPGIDGRFGVVTRIHDALFLEISPGINVIFTDEEPAWALSAYVAMGLQL